MRGLSQADKEQWKKWNIKKISLGDFPVGPMAKTHTPNTGGPGSLPVWETRSCMPPLRPGVCVFSHLQLFAMPWTVASQTPLPFTISNSCPLSQWCYLIMSSSATCFWSPSVLPSIRVFSNESALSIRWPKDWSFSFSISPCNEYSGLISFRIDWFDLLAVLGTLKSTTK